MSQICRYKDDQIPHLKYNHLLYHTLLNYLVWIPYPTEQVAIKKE
jgi:hypothetical protein